MPRIGTNPSRSKELQFEPARVTVAVLVYAPHKVGYFQNRLDVTRLTIGSILANTQMPFNLLVFDNGSCQEMVAFLQELYQAGRIDQLILSKHNIGKLNALYQIFKVAPGEVVAYTDDDVYHLPGWLEAHLEVLDTFPNVGAVTGFYIKQRVAMSSEATLKFAEEGAETVRRGMLIPDKWEQEYMDNTGRSEERYESEVAGIEDVIVGCKGLEAWVSAHHFQFLSTKKVMLPIFAEMLPQGWSDQLMGRMVEMDDLMDGKGYLRLCTLEQTVMLLGNAINEEMAAIAKSHGLDSFTPVMQAKQSNPLRGLAGSRFIRNGLQAVINFLYKLVNEGRE